ncbi:ATP-binding protein [Haloarcula litorea]
MTLESIQLSNLVETIWETVSATDAILRVETERTVEADRDQLRQLLTNLLRNSVEHGGPAVTVTVGDTANGFYVADDGAGLPEAAGEDVFDAGYTTADNGTGFGLSIVEEVASRHGWTVTASNGACGGARFEISTE